MKYLSVVLLCLFLSRAYTQHLDLNYSKMNYGHSINYLTARSLGLAGSGSAGDEASLAVNLNPALSVHASSQLSLTLGGSFFKLEEDRTFPYYDNFGGFVDYGSYVFNQNWYEGYYGILSARLPFLKPWELSIATGYVPFSDFNYDYLEEVRSDFYGDALLAYNIFSSSGTLYAVPLSIGFSPFQGLVFQKKVKISVGATVALLSGSLKQNWRIETKDPSLQAIAYNLSIDRNLDNQPWVPSLGIQIQAGERFTLAAALRLAHHLEFKQDTLLISNTFEKIQKINYPIQQVIGLDYRFQNILAARVFLDLSYTYWESFKDSWNKDLKFNNSFNIRAGVEHIFFNKVPLRVGFDYGTLRENKNYSKTLLAIGSGFYLDKIRFDFAAGLSALDYFQQDLFDNANYGLESSKEADKVQWHEFYGCLDLNYSF